MPADWSELTVEEIRQRLQSKPPPKRFIAQLKADRRKGVREIVRNLQLRQRNRRRERARISKMLRLERKLWKTGVRYVAGVDEAGVGPLAGPVVAAAVIFPRGAFIEGLDDSKRLAADERLELAAAIERQAVAVGVGQADVHEIDRLNVYWASLLAMRRAVNALSPQPEHLLVDARRIPDLSVPQQAIIAGDRLHFSIAAASVMAKTRRDWIMGELDRIFPGYGFARHKGYSTPEHQRAIRRRGACPAHRASYAFVQELSGRCSDEFYLLKKLLEDCESIDDLALFARQWTRLGGGLSEVETRKLRALRTRKASDLPRPRQMKLVGDAT